MHGQDFTGVAAVQTLRASTYALDSGQAAISCSICQRLGYHPREFQYVHEVTELDAATDPM